MRYYSGIVRCHHYICCYDRHDGRIICNPIRLQVKGQYSSREQETVEQCSGDVAR
jgi:hypothetical protein